MTMWGMGSGAVKWRPRRGSTPCEKGVLETNINEDNGVRGRSSDLTTARLLGIHLMQIKGNDLSDSMLVKLFSTSNRTCSPSSKTYC